MKTVARVWEFVAGDSRRTPVGVALAVVAVLALERAHASDLVLALSYAGIIAAGLAWAAFETP